MAGEFCLRWNNHHSTLVSVLDSLLEKETFVDVVLAAEGQSVKVHRVVLCACSEYFQDLLSHQTDKQAIVFLKDVSFTDVRALVDYMYRGVVNVCQDRLATFLQTAEALKINGLAYKIQMSDLSSAAATQRSSTTVGNCSPEPNTGIHIEDPDSMESGVADGDDPFTRKQGGKQLQILSPTVLNRRAGSSADISETASSEADVPQNPAVEPENHFALLNPKVELVESDMAVDPPMELPSVDGVHWNKVNRHATSTPRNNPAQLQSTFQRQRQDWADIPGTSQQRTTEPTIFDQPLNSSDSESWSTTVQTPTIKTGDQITPTKDLYGQDRYHCPQCQRVYQHKCTLIRHLNSECGVQPRFTCPFCPYKATRRDNMSIHIQRKHESYHIPKTRTRQPAASSLVAAAVASRSAPAQHVKLEGAYTLPGEAPK